MKNMLLLLSLLTTTCLTAQNTHQLIGFDTGYNPDTLYMAPGDTVQFTSVGYHSATEIDSIDWVNNIDNPNGGFDVGFGAPTSDMWFVINTPGTYYYICEVHAAMGMKGVIIADATAELEEINLASNFNFYAIGNDSYKLEHVESDHYRIFNLSGQLILEGELDVTNTETILDRHLIDGAYVVRFSKNGNTTKVKKGFVKN